MIADCITNQHSPSLSRRSCYYWSLPWKHAQLLDVLKYFEELSNLARFFVGFDFIFIQYIWTILFNHILVVSTPRVSELICSPRLARAFQWKTQRRLARFAQPKVMISDCCRVLGVWVSDSCSLFSHCYCFIFFLSFIDFRYVFTSSVTHS